MASASSTKSSPYKYTAANHGRFCQHSEAAYAEKKDLGNDMNGNFIGPISAKVFINKLMPVSSDASDRFKQKRSIAFEFPSRTTEEEPESLENELYDAFNVSIKKHGLSPYFKFHISAGGTPKGGDVPFRPGGGFEELPRYTPPVSPESCAHNTRGHEQHLAVDDADEEKKKRTDYDRREFDWCSDGLAVEFKRASRMDPFFSRAELKREVDQGAETVSFEKSGTDHVITRGQLTLYATEIFAHQHRLRLFQILICGRYARFLYWDHSGAIVTHRFDYTTNPRALARFIWHYNHMSAHARGLDSTATLATVEESLEFEEAIKQLLRDMEEPENPQRRLPHASDTLKGSYNVFKLAVFDDEAKTTTEVLVRKAFVSHASVIGRGTRGYLAYHTTLKVVTFLKDTWRVLNERLEEERKLIRDLSEAGVPSLPTVLCRGDTRQADRKRAITRSLDWVMEQVKLPIRYTNLRTFCQHRLLEELAYPPESPTNSSEFIRVMIDIFNGIGFAHIKHKALHRDVSIGNIMLKLDDKNQARGILIDWDHSGIDNSDSESETQNFRTGTWQFMSIGLLADPTKTHDLFDDYESAFWAILYFAAHWFKLRPDDGGKDSTLPIDLRLFDDSSNRVFADGKIYKAGGAYKREALEHLSKYPPNFSSGPLNKLISRIAKEWYEFYNLRSTIAARELGASVQPETSSVPESELASMYHDIDGYEEVLDELEDDLGKDDEQEQDDLDELRKRMKTLMRHLRNPLYWARLLFRSARGEGWDMSDMLPQDRFPRMTKNQADQQRFKEIQSSHITGSDMAARDAKQQGNVDELRQHSLVPPKEQAAFEPKPANNDSRLRDKRDREDLNSDDDADEDDVLPTVFSTSSRRSDSSGKRPLSSDGLKGSDLDPSDGGHPLKKLKLPASSDDEFLLSRPDSPATTHLSSHRGSDEDVSEAEYEEVAKKGKGKGKGKAKEYQEEEEKEKEARPMIGLRRSRRPSTKGKGKDAA